MKWLVIIPVSILAIIVGISIYLQPNDFIGCSEVPLEGTGNCQKADAIVVVSGGDTTARTSEGIKLFKNGWADSLVFAGAAQDKTGLSNAAAMKLQALSEGVPLASVYVDEDSETTEENALNTQSILNRYHLSNVILVTSGYHQRRTSLEFEKRANLSTILNHPVLNDKDWSMWWWTTSRGWWLAGSELVKIVAFYISGSAS